MKLITDQYQETGWPIRVACNVVINLKLDEVMTRVGLICKQSESMINPKKETVLCGNFDRG